MVGSASDEVLREKGAGLPVVRIRPTGIAAGPADPGGWWWVLAAVVGGWWLARRAGRRRG